ncbi:undecaprenyl/decaprenyl-phosphate alpha-N-acetylglucosaminyl 1-phosphate transferase [Omnitrophica bacterium]|nr:undecaprenyl/decaprenyl-phosphate alpha-N-acetylglucosaminyl 1-phosphate transferase [Candidatus Omnitrophota bacterium]
MSAKDFFYSSLDIVAAFIISLTIAYLLTPTIRALAKRIGLVDKPSDETMHRHATPLLGGLAIFIAYFLAVIFTRGINRDIASILIGGTILLAIGIFDDRYGMMPKIKLFGQIIAALTVVKMGIKVEFIENYYLASVFSCIWIIGITNAINLVDGLDGLSGGITAISAFFFALLSWERGDFAVATLASALFGSSLGFFRYNFPRAFIFMGDAGSMFVGFILANIAILGSWTSPTQITSLAIPIFILGYPIFDTFLVVMSRLREGESVFIGRRDHPHHRFVQMGFKKKHAVLIIFSITFCLGLAGYALSKIKDPVAAIWLAAVVFLLMIALTVRLFMVDPYAAKAKKKKR